MSTQQTARQKIQKQQRQERRAALLKRVLIGVAATVAAVEGVTLAIVTAGSGGPSGPLVTPRNAQGTTVVYGKADAPRTLDLYEDFRCPACRNLETTEGKTIQRLADEGTYKINFHFGAFLDDRLGGSGSLDALAAAGAALDQSPEKFKRFHDVLYANQPDESSDVFGDTGTLLTLAAQVPGLRTPEFERQLRDGTFKPWAAQVAAAFNESGVSSTPTAKLDGRKLDLGTAPFATLIAQATAR
ncbi:thioredoxin domain-containing protein [Actinocorallia lasiicapitis]